MIDEYFGKNHPNLLTTGQLHVVASFPHSPCPAHLFGLAVVIASNRRIGLFPSDIPLGGALLHLRCQLVVCNVVMMTVRARTRTMGM